MNTIPKGWNRIIGGDDFYITFDPQGMKWSYNSEISIIKTAK